MVVLARESAADAASHLDGVALEGHGHRRQRLAHPLADANQRRPVHAGEDREELLAPVAADRVGDAQRSAEPFGHHAEDLVACGVAIGVVDLLEVVDVEDGQTEPPGVASLLGELARADLLDRAAVPHAREHVDRRFHLELAMRGGELELRVGERHDAELLLRDVREVAKGRLVVGAERARPVVSDAERRDGASLEFQGDAGVEHERGRGRVVGDARVGASVLDEADVVRGESMLAVRRRPATLDELEPLHALDPQPVGRDQVDHRDRHVEDPPRKTGDLVEALLGGRPVEGGPSHGSGAQALVGQGGRGGHERLRRCGVPVSERPARGGIQDPQAQVRCGSSALHRIRRRC
ncbi:MAG: hypothetical protein JWP97_6502 [Labilithrix sp.]|nr:hypothetical protein [Labilithrix sp.]